MFCYPKYTPKPYPWFGFVEVCLAKTMQNGFIFKGWAVL
jgi:hypothetical protein